MKNIVLIGMPACGKSTLGVLIAKTLGMSFLDTDLIIQQQENMLLQDIIDEKGNDYFRQLEEKVLLDVNVKNTVISTGGSAVYYPAAIDHLKENGTVVYVDVSFETIEKRLRNIKTRGVTMAPGQTLEELYNSRAPLYEQAFDVKISSENLSMEETIETIVAVMAI